MVFSFRGVHTVDLLGHFSGPVPIAADYPNHKPESFSSRDFPWSRATISHLGSPATKETRNI